MLYYAAYFCHCLEHLECLSNLTSFQRQNSVNLCLKPQWTVGEGVQCRPWVLNSYSWCLGKLQLVTLRAAGCAVFYLMTGRQQFPWKELARKQGQWAVGWKTALCRPAGEERKKERRDQGKWRERKKTQAKTKEKLEVNKTRGREVTECTVLLFFPCFVPCCGRN